MPAGSFALLVAACAACKADPEVTDRTVVVHAPARCVTSETPLDGQAYADYYALGDFDPATPATGHTLDSLGVALPEIANDAQMLVVEATEADREWQGMGPIAAAGEVDVLVTPTLTSCALSTHVGSRSGSVLAPFGDRRVLVVGGTAPTTDGASPPAAAPTYSANLQTGAVQRASPDLLTPRTRAGVTAFGDGALVAGGVDPRAGGAVLSTAEVFDAALGGFDQQSPILLSGARADPGAVVLATGETLLVGGIGADGKSVLDSMEIVDPATRTVRAENVARLAVARSAPSVLRLASGEILVLGGLDASGTPVPTLEWFAADASAPTKRAATLVQGQSRASVALEAGGALVVVAPAATEAQGFENTWVIGADGSVEAATPVPGMLAAPVLFGGAGGAPVLWTGDRWLRWQPWGASFAALDVLDDTPAHVGDATASPDEGLAFWLDSTTPALTALRFDALGAYSTLPGPLLTADTSDTAPDRLPGAGVAAFDPSVGATLGPGASAFVTDRTYADVAIDVDAPTGEPALVVSATSSGTSWRSAG